MNVKESHENLRKRKPSSEIVHLSPDMDELRRQRAMDFKVGYTRNRVQENVFETGY